MKFQDVAMPHFNSLYNFALTIAAKRQDAEDLVQETYCRAFKNFDQFDYGANVKAWMFRILRNIAIDNLRKKDALQVANNESYEEELFPVAAKTTNVINAIDLKNALNKLPEKLRIVVLLKDVEGFSYQEIADILCFPKGTVMSRLFRGRKELFAFIAGGKQCAKPTNKIVMMKK